MDPLLEKIALVVDDSEVNRKVLAAYLDRFGFTVKTAGDAEEGLLLFREHYPSLVFLDIVMPKISGIELLRKIKAIDPSTIVVMISAYVSKQTIQEAKEANADWFLMKPFTGEKIQELIHRFEV
ncbi:MAG: response regulator [Chlorobi bacterium]|nr:response regulator [Chlorobiota bacterium]